MRLQSRSTHRPTLRRRTATMRDRELLRRDLSTYTTEADRLELAAMLEHAEPADAAYVRSVFDEITVS